jgi:uncharacterized membrane protein
MRSDIISGLKNAMERGSTLQQAMQSFINAGYNPAEVQQAAQSISQGITQVINPAALQRKPAQPAQPPQTTPQPPAQPTKQEIRRLPAIRQEKKKKSKKKLISIILLSVTLLVLIGLLIYTLFYGKDIISSFFT